MKYFGGGKVVVNIEFLSDRLSPSLSLVAGIRPARKQNIARGASSLRPNMASLFSIIQASGVKSHGHL